MAREASVERNTKETEIKLKLNLDGTGYSDIETGVGFFDHMLDGFTRHGLFDLAIRVHGDLQVDDHHDRRYRYCAWFRDQRDHWGQKRHPPLRKLYSAYG